MLGFVPLPNLQITNNLYLIKVACFLLKSASDEKIVGWVARSKTQQIAIVCNPINRALKFKIL